MNRHGVPVGAEGSADRYAGAPRAVRGTGAAGGISELARESLRLGLGRRVRFDAALARHTSLRVGGPAGALVCAESIDDVRVVQSVRTAYGVALLILGGGSNILISDNGFPGLVLRLGRSFGRVRWDVAAELPTVAVGAAMRLGRLAREAVARNLSGVEFAEGIPGTVGGGLAMNAGAYGNALDGLVLSVDGVAAEGRAVTLEREQLRFGYRRTELPEGFIVTEVCLRLRRAAVGVPRAAMRAVRSRRNQTQPHGVPSAGSMFKNPAGDHAGRLIEAAGLKEARVGQAQIAARHGNFILNLGGARASDIKALMDLAQRVVWERFHIWLEPEVRLVGVW